MIRLEIYGETNGVLQIALYYPVPVNLYNSLSVDLTRTPAGTLLTTPELQALKNGRLVEVLTTLPIDSKPVNELRRELEDLWQDKRETARRSYIQAFNYVGRSWDGVWR